MTAPQCNAAIIGAGPYGLAAAAHLRSANVDVHVFGKAMEFWDRQMPAGMLLRSYWEGSHISDPRNNLTLDEYQRVLGVKLQRPLRRENFVKYGQWFQHQAIPDLDERRIARIEPASNGFRLVAEDGESIWAQRVVVATGISSFARKPILFNGLPPQLVSHASDHRDFAGFVGQRVIVLGGGQSALESAALLHESGAAVEIIVRAPMIHWLRYGTRLHNWLHDPANPLRRILYPPSDVGPPGLNWLVDTPALFRRLPAGIHARFARRAIRPAGAGWLRPRMNGIRITTGRTVVSAQPTNQQIRLKLDDGTERSVEHVLLATGYQVDLSRCAFLAGDIVRSLRRVDGYPKLNVGFEASLPGLYFVGATAARSFGPLMRFVAGTKYAASAVTRYIVRQAAKPARSRIVLGEWDGLAQSRARADR